MNPESSLTLTPETASSRNVSTLARRKQSLAQPLLADETQDSLEIVVFYLGNKPKPLLANDETKINALNEVDNTANGPLNVAFGQYAFETAQVREVFPVSDASQIAMLPGTPPWVRGILNVRGRILAVLDLQRLFGLPAQETISGAPVLILRSELIAEAHIQAENEDQANETLVVTGDVALATNGVAGVHIVPRTHLETGHSLDGTPGARYLRGLTQDGIALLDAALLLSDVQLNVQSE